MRTFSKIPKPKTDRKWKNNCEANEKCMTCRIRLNIRRVSIQKCKDIFDCPFEVKKNE